MLAVALGLAGSVIFGAADFIGGLAAKRISAIRVTFISGLAGLAVTGLGSLIVPGEWSLEAMFWGALAGVFGSSAIMLLYASLAIGPMSILSPLAAFVSAVFPIAWALASGESLSQLGLVGLGVGLVAVVLVAFIPEKNAVRPSLRGVLYAVSSGILIGAFLICIDRAPNDAGLYPLIANRFANALIMGGAILVIFIVDRIRSTRAVVTSNDERAVRRTGWRAGLTLALICGVIDGTGNALLLAGIQLGDLSVMSVLTALYPAGTIILAAVLLKERVARVQAIGLVFAIVAAALLALA